MSARLVDQGCHVDDAALLVQRANTIVTGSVAYGKTAAFAIPALQHWCGPAIYLTTAGAYANKEIVKARRDLGRVIEIDLDNDMLGLEQRRFRLALSSEPGQDRVGTILVKVRDGIAQLMSDKPSLVKMFADELVFSLTAAMASWIVDTSLEALRTSDVRVVQPLLILDDHWALSPVLSRLLDAIESRHFVALYDESVLLGVEPRVLAELGKFEAYVGTVGSATVTRFRAYYETT